MPNAGCRVACFLDVLHPGRVTASMLLAVVSLLGVSIPVAAQEELTPVATSEPWVLPEQTAICEFDRPDSAFVRAQNDLAFIGVVTGFVQSEHGQHIVTTRPPVSSLIEIDVEQVLNGELPETIRVRYQGDCANTQRLAAVRWPLPGDRSLSFPLLNRETGKYFGSSVFSVLPIKSARQEARLIARFGPGGVVGAEDNFLHCYQASRGQKPDLMVEPTILSPGDLARVTSVPLPKGWVTIGWDDQESWRTGESAVVRSWVGKDCTLDASITVPAAASGQHQIMIRHANETSRQVRVTLEIAAQNSPRQPNTACQTLASARAVQRAMLGEIFVGTVLGPAVRNRPANRPTEDVPCYLRYSVAVTDTIRGAARGEVRVLFHGACQGIVHEQNARAPQPGEQFLFFADRDLDQARFYVDPVAGLTRIGSPAQESELIAAYSSIIAWMNDHPGRLLPPGDCFLLDEPPTITVTPKRVQPGDTLYVSGGAFFTLVPTFPFEIGGRPAGTSAVDRNCQVTATLTVPDLEPGEHQLFAGDAEGGTVSVTVKVVDETGKPPKSRQQPARLSGEGN